MTLIAGYAKLGPMDVAVFIATERKKLGVSQRALAKRIRVSGGLIGQWESRHSVPPLERLLDLCAGFGIAPSTVFGEGGPLQGRLLTDADEIGLINAWRRMGDNDRSVVRRFLAGIGYAVPSEIDDT